MTYEISGIPSRVTQAITRASVTSKGNGTSTDAYVAVLNKEQEQYDVAHIFIKNTGATNDLEYSVYGYVDDAGTQFTVLTNNLLPTNSDTVVLTRAYSKIIISVKSSVATFATTYDVELIQRG